MHRIMHVCQPWITKGKDIFFGKVIAPEQMFPQCRRYLCQVLTKEQIKKQK